MDNELLGAAAHSHQYYTIENGDYDNNRRAEGAMLLLLGLSLTSVLGTLVGDIHNAIKQRHKIK